MRHPDEIAKLMTTKEDAIFQTQPFEETVELTIFDSGHVTIAYLTTGEVQQLIDMLEEYL
ncbi:MAG: hypothetical protein ACREI9_13065 [Nitrospiraceae bacterium]